MVPMNYLQGSNRETDREKSYGHGGGKEGEGEMDGE